MARQCRSSLAVALVLIAVNGAWAYGGQLLQHRAAGTVSSARHRLRSARRATAGGDDDGALAQPQTDHGTEVRCSCDCCTSQVVSRAASGGSSDADGALVCVPRSQGVQTGDASGQCQDICQVHSNEVAHFNAVTREVDYQRFCLDECISAGEPFSQDGAVGETLLCAPKGSFEGGGDSAKGGKNVSEAVSEEKASFVIPTTPAPPTATPFRVTSAILAMAKSNMEDARRHAEAAGRSAKAARMAYEAAKASALEMGKAAAKAQYREMEKAASEQAWETFQIRRKYEKDSQAAAQKAAIDAASVYAAAKQRDLTRAGEWAERANQYQAAADERRAAAQDAAAQANMLKKVGQKDAALDFASRAAAAEDQAAKYEKMAVSAKKESTAIQDNLKDYDVAALAAAKYMMARALPPDVPAPPLPMIAR